MLLTEKWNGWSLFNHAQIVNERHTDVYIINNNDNNNNNETVLIKRFPPKSLSAIHTKYNDKQLYCILNKKLQITIHTACNIH